jgi:rfaE bifunctional protein kinase chain/domain
VAAKRNSKKVLVVGDFIDDVYTKARTTRNCPEAPAPVYDVYEERRFPGCAGNVAMNIASFLPKRMRWRVCAAGPMSETVVDDLQSNNVTCLPDPWAEGFISKRRLIVDDRIVCRIDSSRWCPGVTLASQLSSKGLLSNVDAVVVSDYGFGALDDASVRAIMSCGRPVFVDSKRKDLSVFRGATVFKLNESEWAEQTSICARGPDLFVESLCGFCVVTRGSRGCDVRTRCPAPRGGYSTDSIMLPAYTADQVVDVTGCGDTFLAALVYAMVFRERDVFFGSRFANYVASRAVGTLGPFVPSDEQARGMIDKFFDEEDEDEAGA